MTVASGDHPAYNPTAFYGVAHDTGSGGSNDGQDKED